MIGAVLDAISHLGVKDIQMPATPERVWRAIQEAKGVIPARFDYDVAESVEHAIELLAAGGDDTTLLAGGQSLIPALRLRIARPAKLVDLGRLADLAYVKDDGTHVAIGSMTRHATVAKNPLLVEHCPIVSHTAAQIGDPQVRHRGTIGGTLSHGDPASDMPAVVLALGADLVTRGQERRAGDRGDGLLHGRLRDRARARRGAGRGARPEALRVHRMGRT